jgi:subfamily B ATP-binding cassette protein MsbA
LLHPGELRPEVFITYIVVFSQIISPAKAFANAWYYIQKGSASLLRIESLLAEKPTVLDAPDAVSLNYSGQDIRIQNLNFQYKDTPVLTNINLLIQQGKKIAIAGPSGSGKTTLVHLLCRLYPIPEQSILMGETPIEQYSLESLRKQFAFVTQEPLLFYGSVKENLLMAKPNSTESEILNALKMAHADAFVEALPNGMNTNIGERGTQLSGGQQQRISLARAFLKNAPILLLDEATAALDNYADHAIQSAVLQLQQGKTVIAIAHRLSSVKDYDMIVVMNQGEILATGTHAELMEECGLYREMVLREGI